MAQLAISSQEELDTLPRCVMTSDELWDPVSLFQQHSSEEAHTRLVSSTKINQETINCNPSKAQTAPNDPESDNLLIGISSSLTLETMLPRILASIRVSTYLPENNQEESRKISAIGFKTRHSIVSLEELSRKWRVGINIAR